MLLRIHRSADNHEVIAICDRELLGRTLEEGDLTVKISEPFFGGEEIREEKLLEVLRTCGNINMFGKKCVEIAVRNGFIAEESCREIAGVPHVTILGL